MYTLYLKLVSYNHHPSYLLLVCFVLYWKDFYNCKRRNDNPLKANLRFPTRVFGRQSAELILFDVVNIVVPAIVTLAYLDRSSAAIS